MNGKQGAKSPTKKKRKKHSGLTPTEIKRLKELKKQQQKKKEKPTTAQKTIPYKEVYKDGVCKVTDDYFSKTVEFFDINYQLAQNDTKTLIFENYCEFLNYFDPSIKVQLSLYNQEVDIATLEKAINIPMQEDEFDEIREEYINMLKHQLAEGNNGLVKRKFITFGVNEKNLKNAKERLNQITEDVIGNFKTMGVLAKGLSGVERLEVMHHTMNMDTMQPFRFSYNDILESGMSTKDYIAPTGFDFRYNCLFQMGQSYSSVSSLQITCPELSDKMLVDFLNIDKNMMINIHINPINQKEAIKKIKGKLSDLQTMQIDDQKKAARDGYDIDIIASDIVTLSDDAKTLLNELQSRNEKYFIVNFLIMNTAATKRELKNVLGTISGVAQKYNCNIRCLQHMQEQGFVSSLPLGLDETKSDRGLTTTSTAIFVPFTTQELFMQGQALYYGLNALSKNMIMVDRKKLKNPNGLILGTPGSGKSFSAKREMLNVFLITDDDIIIADPEGEYYPLVSALNGQVVKISSKSTDYINPMDVNLDIVYNPEKYRVDGDVEDIETMIADKSEFLISFCEMVMRKPKGQELDGDEIAIIDHCVKELYEEFLYNDPKEENMPILADFLNCLLKYEEKNDAARRIASSLQLYVTGSQNVFNHRTNVNMNNRVVCFNIKELGNTLRKVGMLIIQNMVWTRVSVNRALKKSTRYYVDEFHLLLSQPQTAVYSVEIWKRFRKWGGIPTGITQNVNDLLISREIENIFGNSDFIYMLNQNKKDQDILAEKLNISPQQLSYVTNSNAGEGLIFYGNVVVPFVDKYPTNTKTYAIMTTKLDET